MPTPLINAEHLHYQRGDKTILSNVSLSIHNNEVVTIVGPNGAGKSSLLRLLVKLDKPTKGKVEHKKDLRFGYMPQKLQLNPQMPLSVESFLNLSRRHHSPELFDQLLNELNIKQLINSSMHKLSGGEKQRVMLARAVLQKPDILVLDEPAQGIDISGQNRLYELINRAKHIHPCAVLMVSHDLHIVMANTDRVICLNQHICCQGHPDHISNDAAFEQMFGQQLAAVTHYTHRHDHHHDLHGDIIKGEHGEGCQHDH